MIIFLTSIFFELAQLLTRLGSFDVDDIILNMMGGLIGWLIFRGFVLLLRLQPGRGF